MEFAIRVLGFVEIGNALVILAWASALYLYAKILGEFLCAIIGFFVRSSYIFRWIVKSI